MFSMIIVYQVKPEHREALLEAVLTDAQTSLRVEPGCIRVDVHQDNQDPNRLYLYEVWEDEEAHEAHRQTPHFARLRQTVRPEWHAAPTQIFRATPLFPAPSGFHKPPL